MLINSGGPFLFNEISVIRAFTFDETCHWWNRALWDSRSCCWNWGRNRSSGTRARNHCSRPSTRARSGTTAWIRDTAGSIPRRRLWKTVPFCPPVNRSDEIVNTVDSLMWRDEILDTSLTRYTFLFSKMLLLYIPSCVPLFARSGDRNRAFRPACFWWIVLSVVTCPYRSRLSRTTVLRNTPKIWTLPCSSCSSRLRYESTQRTASPSCNQLILHYKVRIRYEVRVRSHI